MKMRFALLATAVLLVACSDTPVEPNLSPSDAVVPGSPLGLGDCAAQPLKELVKSRLTPGSCNTNDVVGRRTMYFRFDTAPAGQMTTVHFKGDFSPVMGVRQDVEAMTGIVWGAFIYDLHEDPSALSFIGSSPTQQLYVTNWVGNQLGAFELTSKVEPVSYSCDTPMIYEPPFDINITMDAAHSCHNIIRFTPYPPALGKPIHDQFFYGHLLPGKTYEIVVSGLTPSFNAALTVYVGGRFTGLQSAGPLPADGKRRIVVTGAAGLPYYTIEVSTGHPDANGNWIIPDGAYSLAVREL